LRRLPRAEEKEKGRKNCLARRGAAQTPSPWKWRNTNFKIRAPGRWSNREMRDLTWKSPRDYLFINICRNEKSNFRTNSIIVMSSKRVSLS
jgi:hypothetical protein